MRLVYVAGPYRSKDGAWGVERNIQAARAVARRYWLNGDAVICPHANTAFMDGADGLTDDMFLSGDFEMLQRCDAIVMMRGWETSAGANAELNHAIHYGLEVIYDDGGAA